MRRALVLLGLCACSRETPPTAVATSARGGFQDITLATGIAFRHDAGQTSAKHLPETMGAGAGLGDFDSDGDLDLIAIQGGPLTPSEGSPVNRLFQNDGRGRFSDQTERSGDLATPGYGMGLAIGDCNADGALDVYLTRLGADLLLFGDGKAAFRDHTQASGIDEPRWTTSAVFFDGDQDGDLDLFVTSYVAVDLQKPLWCGERRPGWRSYCHPDAYEGLEDRYWKNLGDGRFIDATGEAGFSDPGGKGLGVAASDLDGGAIVCPDDYECSDAGTCIGSLACNNGVDDDGDGLIDWPAEPGCSAPDDTDETDGRTYLLHFALPNVYFHATTAYALLRHAGVELGKADFLGAMR